MSGLNWPKPRQFDGAKFAARYGLQVPERGQPDFYELNGRIYLREGLTLPDNPPIFEAPDPVTKIRVTELYLDTADGQLKALLADRTTRVVSR